MAHRPPVRPVVWQPPPRPARARSRTSATPFPPLRLIEVGGHGPEDVVVDAAGMVVTGVADGRLLRVHPDTGLVENIADTGGRPLGVELLADGRLLVCDAARGLLLVDRGTGAVEVLLPRGRELNLCNNAAVARDGTVYFTDSTSRFDLEDYVADLLEHSGTGRLLRRDPDGTVTTVLTGLYFANGVALAPDESYVVVAQTGAYRLDKVFLTGPKAGTSVILEENLAGFPDNIATGSDGLVWIAMASPRDRLLDQASRLHPNVRKVIWALPEKLRPKEKRTVWVRAIDGDSGRKVHEFFGTPTDFHMVTGVREHEGDVWMGSLLEPAVAVLRSSGA
jgi:sugar lactone lactonase YvrE